MSVEQALCREVALLLSQSERHNKDSPNKAQGNANPTKAGPSTSLVEQASMFASTWNFISSSIDASRPPSQEIGECYNEDNSDLGAYLSSVGNNSNNANANNTNMKASTEDSDSDSADALRKVSSEERLIEDLNKNNYFPCELMGQGPFMSDSAYDLCPTGINSAGAPSTVQSQSFYGLLSGLTDITLKLPEIEPGQESGDERNNTVTVSKTAASSRTRSLKNISQTISNNENNENPSCNNYDNRSRCFIKSKEMEGNRNPSGAQGAVGGSGGINGILDLDLECSCSSSGTVGSTHRSSPVPRCAVDYVQRIRTSHPSESDIPSEMYKYLVGSDLNADPSSRPLNTHEMLQHDNGIPILLEEGPSPTNRSFLNNVNDEIKKIQYDEAKARSIYSATMGDFITTINSNTQYGQLFNGRIANGNPREGGTSSHLNNFRRRTGTAIINSNTRDQVKAESGVQTEAESAQGQGEDNLENSLHHNNGNSVGIANGTRNGSTSSMWMGETQSEEPSHISSMASIRERNLGVRRLRPQQQQQQQQLYPINPGATSAESLEIREQQLQLQRQRAMANRGDIFGNFMNVNTALGLTKYSLQAAWNTAEEIFRGYIVPPEISEDRGPVAQTGDERVANETHVSVSIMRLLGLPLESRQTIYREVLGDMNAIQEFSVETINMISSVIDWVSSINDVIGRMGGSSQVMLTCHVKDSRLRNAKVMACGICTGNHSGAEDLIAKTRVLATSQTEVDLDSDDWKNFERDIGLFTNAVASAVGSAANLVSRQCTESADSLRRMTTSTTSTPLPDRSSSVNVALHRSNNILESVTSIISNTMTGMHDFGSRTTSRTTTRESEYGSNVNPALIAQMITDSEFELLPTESASLSRTESLATSTSPSVTDTISGRGGQNLFSKSKSRIPIPVASSTVPVSPTSNSDLRRDSIPPKALSNRESCTRFKRERQNECSNKTKRHQNQNQNQQSLNQKNSSRDLLSNKSSVKFSSSTLLERTSQETLARRGKTKSQMESNGSGSSPGSGSGSKMQQVSKAGRKDETLSTGTVTVTGNGTGTGTKAKNISQLSPSNQPNHHQQDQGSHGTFRREQFLSPEDAELLKECRRLTKVSGPNRPDPDPGSSRNSSLVLNDSNSQRFTVGRRNEETLSGQQLLNNIEIEPAEVANLATAIATVASCVTTALLGRAASAASYIPSLSDTFGIQAGPDEYRFAESIMDLDNHEDSFLDSINKAAATASSILFGLDGSVSAENNSATTRPSNRKIRSRGANSSSLKESASEVSPNVSPFHINSSPQINQSSRDPVRQHQQQHYEPHLDSADLTRQVSLNNNSIQGQSHLPMGEIAGQHNNNNNNNNTILSMSSSPSEQDIDPAWQLFDYIKYQEAEANFANHCETETHCKNPTSPAAGSSTGIGNIEFESGISEESPPEEIQVKPKPKSKPKTPASITARLSKASLNALFDTFQEYHPTNGRGTSYKTGNADQIGNKNGSLSNANLRTASQIFKAISKSNGNRNSKHSLISNSNTNSNSNFSHDLDLGSPSPSLPVLTVPQNSNVEMTREMAEMQMHEDIAYLENIVNALYESNLIENPNLQQDEPESEPAELEPEPEPVPVPELESESASLLNVTASDSETQVQSLSLPSEPKKIETTKVPVPAKNVNNPTKKLPVKTRNRNSSNSLRKETEKPRANQGYGPIQSPSPRNSPSSSLRQSVQSSGTSIPNQRIIRAKSIPNKTYGKNIGLRSPAASYSRPRIVHQNTPSPQSTGTGQSTRSTPVKPRARIQIISAVPGYLSSTQPSPTPTSTNLSGSRPYNPGTGTGPWPGNESSRSLSHQNQENLVPITGPQTQRPSSSGGGYPYAQKKSSYLKISKQKSTVQSQGQPVSQQRTGKFNSYASRYSAQAQAHEGSVSTLHKLRQGASRPRNNGPVSSFGLRPTSTSTSPGHSQGQESPKTTTTYKYGDGSHSNNSGKNIDGSEAETETTCSSTMSSVPASTNPSRHLHQLALATAAMIGNQGISSSDLNMKNNSSTKNPTDDGNGLSNPNQNNSSAINPPIFFPPLGNPLITFQPLSDIMNPFSSKIPGNKN